MSEWAVIAGTATGIAATGFAAHRWLVKAYLRELLPNHGTSLADRVRRIEDAQTRLHERIDAIYEHIITKP